MSLTFTQVAVTSAATELVTLQPGQSAVLLASASTAVGTANTVTTSTGFTLPANVPVPFPLADFEGAAAVTLYGITASTSDVSVAVTGEP